MSKNLSSKNERLYVRVTPVEKALIEKNMSSTGYGNMSSYIRHMALEGKVVVEESKVDDKLIYEVNKIGNNINQIAKQLNSGETAKEVDVLEIKSEMKKIWQLLKSNL